MTRKTISYFRVTEQGVFPLSPEEGLPMPKSVTYAEEGEAPPAIKRRMEAMRQQGGGALQFKSGRLNVIIEELDENNPTYQRMLKTAPKFIEEMVQKDPEMYGRFTKGGGFQPGMTLTKLREIIGGDEGYWTSPNIPHKIPISLREWADADPDKTRRAIGLMFRSDEDEQRIQELQKLHDGNPEEFERRIREQNET